MLFYHPFIMELNQTPITGTEEYGSKTVPWEALAEFYDAFNHRNLEIMANNWANASTIAMDNPIGGILRGWGNISAIYDRIFHGQAKVYVEFYDYTIHEHQDTFYTVGRERGYFEIRGHRLELAIRTSRVFVRINGEWKQVHHHGSIENPELLKAYQKAVTK